jgi:hypothetical protein
MRLKALAKIQAKPSYMFPVPPSKYYCDRDANDRVCLLHHLLGQVDVIYGDDLNLTGLWGKVQLQR